MTETKEIYQNICYKIFKELEKDGFKYLKSGPTMKKISDDLTFQITFSSSHANIKGHYVALWAFGQVISKKYKDWARSRKYSSSNSKGIIITANLGNLTYPTDWLEWNLADKNDNKLAYEIATVIKKSAYPIFKIFENKQSIINALTNQSFPILSPEKMIEYVYYLEGKETAKNLFDKYLVDFKVDNLEMQKHISEYQLNGIPKVYPMIHSKQFAYIKLALEL